MSLKALGTKMLGIMGREASRINDIANAPARATGRTARAYVLPIPGRHAF